MKPGDLIEDEHFGTGIVFKVEDGMSKAYFWEVGKAAWVCHFMFGSGGTVEVVSESR